MDDLIVKRFLSVTYGYGSGSGDGDGYGYGEGSGYGSGSGSGDGDGSGYGYGSGSGSGYSYGSGDGSGYGSGDGSGYGSGYGSGDGSGYGSGDGFGYGSGYGSGYCDGVISFLGNTAYMVDSIPTIFYSVKSNYAKCAIIQKDLTLKQCFVAKVGNYFAHGSTLKEAFADANAKYMQNLPEEERIRMFEEKFDVNGEYPIRDFYDWHNILTGSCRFGRDSFAQQHVIDLNGIMSVVEFIKLTKNAYNGEIIKKLYGGSVLNM